jgi:hypothetical protein
MEHGRIAQRGRFDELLAADGPFRRLAHALDAEGQLQDDLQSEPVTGKRPSRAASVSSSSSE